jgi:hypothetical protein
LSDKSTQANKSADGEINNLMANVYVYSQAATHTSDLQASL